MAQHTRLFNTKCFNIVQVREFCAPAIPELLFLLISQCDFQPFQWMGFIVRQIQSALTVRHGCLETQSSLSCINKVGCPGGSFCLVWPVRDIVYWTLFKMFVASIYSLGGLKTQRIWGILKYFTVVLEKRKNSKYGMWWKHGVLQIFKGLSLRQEDSLGLFSHKSYRDKFNSRKGKPL